MIINLRIVSVKCKYIKVVRTGGTRYSKDKKDGEAAHGERKNTVLA